MLTYSVFVIIAFAFKIALMLGAWRFGNLDWLGPVGVLATRLFAPFKVEVWQVTSTLNAALAWIFFFRASRHLLARSTSDAWPEAWVRKEYAIFQAVRTTFSLYAIVCTLYIAATTAWQVEWPPICIILFPWTGCRAL
jgi:hypothetical protein